MLNSCLKLFIKMAVFSFLFIFLANTSHASTMSDDQYILNLNNAQTDNQPTHTQDVKGISNTRQGVITGDGFSAEQGFSYIFGLNDFIFSLSPLIIDYGTFSPTNPITRVQNLSVTLGSSYSYTVDVLEDHELILQNGKTISIPSTTCDDGLCSKQFASTWSNPLTFGFGYSCQSQTGNDCVIKQTDHFMQFPNQIDSNNAQSVMDGSGPNKTKQSQIIYKVNTSSTQPKGLYSNTITYLAIPNY